MRARNVWAEVDLSAIAHNVQVNATKSSNRGQKSARLSKLMPIGHWSRARCNGSPGGRRQLSGGVHDTGSWSFRELVSWRLSSFWGP